MTDQGATGRKCRLLTSRRRKPDPASAAVLCDRLRGFDLGLMQLVEECQDDMTLKEAGQLVAMHRKIRRLRYQIEVAAGI